MKKMDVIEFILLTLIIVFIGVLLFWNGTAHAKQATLDLPRPKIVRCRGAKGQCFQYTPSDHKALLVLFQMGDNAMERVRHFERAGLIQKKMEKLTQKKLELIKGERKIWAREKKLVEDRYKWSQTQNSALKSDNKELIRRRNTLEKRVEANSIIKQPAFWGAIITVTVVGIVAGVTIGLNLPRASSVKP